MEAVTRTRTEADRLARLTAGDYMRTELVVLGPDTSLATAARLFNRRHISGAPVVDGEGRPLGVVSLTDLMEAGKGGAKHTGKPLYYLLDHGERDFVGMFTDELVGPPGEVADVMTDFVLSVGPKTPLLQAVRLMVADGVHRVLVVEGGKLVGILTSMDVMRALVASPVCPPS